MSHTQVRSATRIKRAVAVQRKNQRGAGAAETGETGREPLRVTPAEGVTGRRAVKKYSLSRAALAG